MHAGETVKLAPLAVVAVMVIAVTVAGFEWPVPTHGANIFHLRLEKQARSTGLRRSSVQLKITRNEK